MKAATIEYFAELDNARLANLCGVLDENLRQIEAALDVTIKRRGARFTIAGSGSTKAREQAKRALEYFATMSDEPLSVDEVLASDEYAASPGASESSRSAAASTAGPSAPRASRPRA